MSMLTSRRIAAFVIFGLAASVSGTHIRALEGAKGVAAPEKAPLQSYRTPRAALRAGLEEFRAGDSSSAIEALKYAAAGGESLARWKLARLYATGDGVPRDDLKAYDYFSQIVASYDEDSPNRRDISVVSSAFVAVGLYRLNGIPNSKVQRDPARAIQMFQYAATNFRDANAQYQLARMHLDGVGVGKDSRQALRWLYLAAGKGHLQAQALLGQVLFSGQDGVRPRRGQALMWLTLARESAVDSKKDQWIIDLYDKAMAAAGDDERQSALDYLEDYLKRRK
jgi:hypothetical protein